MTQAVVVALEFEVEVEAGNGDWSGSRSGKRRLEMEAKVAEDMSELVRRMGRRVGGGGVCNL